MSADTAAAHEAISVFVSSVSANAEVSRTAMNSNNKKLSCRRKAARRCTSLKISISHSRSLNVIRNYTV